MLATSVSKVIKTVNAASRNEFPRTVTMRVLQVGRHYVSCWSNIRIGPPFN